MATERSEDVASDDWVLDPDPAYVSAEWLVWLSQQKGSPDDPDISAFYEQLEDGPV